jgi:hypothetical protein
MKSAFIFYCSTLVSHTKFPDGNFLNKDENRQKIKKLDVECHYIVDVFLCQDIVDTQPVQRNL